MATKTRPRQRTAGRAGGRITGGRRSGGRAGRGRSSSPSGPMGLMNRITSTIGRSSGRSGGRGASRGGGLANQASSFVRGFLGGGGRRRR